MANPPFGIVPSVRLVAHYIQLWMGALWMGGIRMANPPFGIVPSVRLVAHYIQLWMGALWMGGIRMVNPEGGCSDNSRGLVE